MRRFQFSEDKKKLYEQKMMSEKPRARALVSLIVDSHNEYKREIAHISLGKSSAGCRGDGRRWRRRVSQARILSGAGNFLRITHSRSTRLYARARAVRVKS